ncbi:MAG TPA: LLM class flavin-dependent oxidoreductase [Anaerolineae bacterium]|nr:LLM class flavin-dependent oxidoreductase [Anaerolineae bacterium]
MKYGLDVSIAGEYANPRLLADLAAEAEQAGWDGFFVQDYMVSDQAVVDPWVALAAIAMQTARLRIGAFMTALPRRRPWKVARETVSLDHLSKGRLIFGAGLGFDALDFTAFGEEADPELRAEKLDEGLAILSGLWTGEPFSFQGKHYQIKEVQLLPRPIQSPRIPVWVAGGWPNRRPFRRAARWDGIYVMTQQANGERVTPKEIREIVAYVKSFRDGSDPFDVAFADETSSDLKKGAKIVQSYAEAGVTWWLEGIWGSDIRKSKERIRSGPSGTYSEAKP